MTFLPFLGTTTPNAVLLRGSSHIVMHLKGRDIFICHFLQVFSQSLTATPPTSCIQLFKAVAARGDREQHSPPLPPAPSVWTLMEAPHPPALAPHTQCPDEPR